MVPNALDPEALAQRHRELSDTLRYGMLGLIGFAFFCTLTVQTPDSELLTRGARVRIPFADTDVDFVTFVWVGPMLLVGYTVILHIFLGQLLALASVPETERSVALFNLGGRLPALITYLVFYWLAPVTVLFFALKSEPLIGDQLVFVAALFAVSLLLLQLRRDAIRPGRMPRQFIWALLVLITFAPPAMTLWPLIEGGKRPLQRSWHLSGANLANTHLIEADLENAKLDRANLQGADLTRAHLRGTNFRNANLKSTKLGNADLREARLDGAVLDRETQFDEANLRYATARNTDLSQANMTPEQLKQICFTKESEQLPEPQLGFFRAHCSGRKFASPSTEKLRGITPPTDNTCNSKIVTILEPAAGYVAACLVEGKTYYVDRGETHTIKTIPRQLSSAVWIKTTNTVDKGETSEKFLWFSINGPAEVYVAYDSRVVAKGSPPEWLTHQFEKTELTIELKEPDPSQSFVLYKNKASSPRGSGSLTRGGPASKENKDRT